MRITFYIPTPLRQHTGGLNKVEIDGSGSTVGEALAALWQAYPGLRDRILTEQGEVRQHVNIFVGEESIRYCGGFAAPLMSGTSITLIPAVSGGVTSCSATMVDINDIRETSGDREEFATTKNWRWISRGTDTSWDLW